MHESASQPERAALRLSDIVRRASWDAEIEPLNEADLAALEVSTAAVNKKLAADEPIYGLTRGFGPFVDYQAESELEQGNSLISHLGTAQGRLLSPEMCRLVLWLRLNSIRKGRSAVSPDFWRILADLWNRGFTPAIPRDGTVSASGDLQPLAHAALAHTGYGETWVRDAAGGWRTQPATKTLADLGVEPITWPVREALAFVNGTGVGLAVGITNHQSALRLVRAGAMLTGRVAHLLEANPEHFHAGHAIARRQYGQHITAEWIRREMRPDATRGGDRPLQEPYSLRCGPQVLGAVLDQLRFAGDLLEREADGCTDNPIVHEGDVLHGGNFHAMPVGFANEQIGLALHMAAYLAERQIGLVLSPTTNGGLPPMLTPRAGRGCGVAGVQISSTSFVARIRQLVYPASLTTLPTNGWNQDHVPMALNSANGVSDALELGWLTIGSLGLTVAQLGATLGHEPGDEGPWAELARISPPVDEDRPMAAEVRAATALLDRTAGELLNGEGWVGM